MPSDTTIFKQYCIINKHEFHRCLRTPVIREQSGVDNTTHDGHNSGAVQPPYRLSCLAPELAAMQTHNSDIDLLVVMPEGTNEKETRIAIRAALCNSPIAKDVLVDTPSRLDRYAKLSGTVQRAALKEGVTLYG